jgi:hypothetical protein
MELASKYTSETLGASGNSALIIKYRSLLIEAAALGEDIKELYGIVPPAIINYGNSDAPLTRISLNVSRALSGMRQADIC